MCLKHPHVATRLCVNCSIHANIETNGTVKRGCRYVPSIFFDKEFYICLKFSDLITLLNVNIHDNWTRCDLFFFRFEVGNLHLKVSLMNYIVDFILSFTIFKCSYED